MKFSILVSTRHSMSANNINLMIEYWQRADIDHEFIVYSEHDTYEGATTMSNPEGDLQSSVFGYNFICKHAKGEYCLVVPDYVTFDTPEFNPLNLYHFLKENEIEIATLTPRDHGWERKERFNINTGNPHGGDRAQNILPEESSVCIFPLIKNDFLKSQLSNHIFHPAFIHHYCDHYITVYVYKKFNIVINQLWDFPVFSGRYFGDTHAGRNDTDPHDLGVVLDLYDAIDTKTSYIE
jgi:uncharacterized protein YuzB (UPF0349 family)